MLPVKGPWGSRSTDRVLKRKVPQALPVSKVPSQGPVCL